MRRAARKMTVRRLLGAVYACALLQASGCLEGDVVVLEPQGGEDFSVGSTMAVRWASIGVGKVRIELSRDGGASWTTIASSTDAADGAHSWAVTDGESQACLVRITDASEGSVSDASDGFFNIGRRGFVVDVPNGEETWHHLGPDRLIEWSSFDVADKVDLFYSVDGGTSWMAMDDGIGVANTGSYVWAVPNFDSTRCRVMVEEAGGGGHGDTSDDDFTIEPLPGVDFVDVDAGLMGVDSCALRWGDYNSDGFFDLIVAGDETGSGDAATRLYLNQGGAGMSLVAGTGLPDVERCALDWGDFDGDGDLDLALAGTTDGDVTGAVTRVYRNESGAFVQAADLTGVVDCAVRWADLDADGDLDLAVAGAGASGPLTTVYLNAGGSFVAVGSLPGVARCAVACSDFDGDDLVDIALAGEDAAGDELAGVYRNLGGGFFEEAQALVGVKDCSLAWGDFDSDGDPDLALAGCTSTGLRLTRVFENKGGTFVDTDLGFVRVDECSLAWGDCDGDGDLDLAVAGVSGGLSVAKVYRNAGDGGGFVDTGALLAGGARSSLAWADWDRDGDLDLAISGSDDSQGRVCLVYENVSSLPNSRPGPPTGLAIDEPASGAVVFYWRASTDAESPPPALTYNLVLRDAYGTEVAPGMSDPASGVRLVPAPGNAGQNRSMTLSGLSYGTYTYSVQAVDPGLAASEWAEWQTFHYEGLDGMAMGAGCGRAGTCGHGGGPDRTGDVPAPLSACSVTVLLLAAAFFQMVKRALRRRTAA